MGGSCKGGCLEEAEAQLVLLYFFFAFLLVKAGRGCLACLRTHWVSNSMIGSESSNCSSALVTVAPK